MNKVSEVKVSSGLGGQFGLSEELIESIRAIFAQYKAVDQAVVYGSRAMGNFKEGSDIDIALKIKPGTMFGLNEFNQIQWQLDDLMSPYRFDLCIYESIDNPEFKAHIDRVGIPL